MNDKCLRDSMLTVFGGLLLGGLAGLEFPQPVPAVVTIGIWILVPLGIVHATARGR